MGKQRQQVLSRFFFPVPKPSSSPDHPSPSAPRPHSPPPPPKTAATVSFSPSKRLLLSKTLTPPSKKPRPSPTYLRQRLHKKLLEPPEVVLSDPSSPNPPKYTPLELQVVELKSRYKDVILMVEVGYRYRFFGEDAEVAARVLGIFCHVDHNFLTASIPTFRLNFHVRRLVGAGYKVGVVKQTETAAIKAHGANKVGPFTRGLSALYTKATIEAAEDLGCGGEVVVGTQESNYLLCVVEEEVPPTRSSRGGPDVSFGMVAVEVSTGDVAYGEFNDNVMRSALEAVVLSLSPAEILLGNPISHPTKKLLLSCVGHMNVRVDHASPCCFGDGGALGELISLYENLGDDSPNLKLLGQIMQSMGEDHREGIEGVLAMPKLAVVAFAVAMRYLKQFGFDRILLLGASFRPFCSDTEIALSADTLNHLEIVKNNYDGSAEGSLLQRMNHTYTSFGSRLLKHWVTHPLRDRKSISSRLDAVSEILDSIGCGGASNDPIQVEEDSRNLGQSKITYVLSSVLMALSRTPDVQRGLTRVFHRTATPSEFIGVIHAILLAAKQLQRLHLQEDVANGEPVLTVKSALLRRLIMTASSSSVITNAAKLLSCLNKDAADKGDMLNLFNTSDNQFPEVAKGLLSIQVVEEKLNLLIPKYRKQLGIHVEFISVSGDTHLIELPSEVKVPVDWLKVNSTRKMTRYHPPEVLKALDELSLTKEELAVTCRETWTNFLVEFGKYYAHLQAAVQAIAALDCLHSLALLSKDQNYIRPEFVSDDEPCQIEIQSGRHPVLESLLGDNFVPNDTYLHAVGERCQIITGPNMGGKTCYIRQVAVIVMMAQVGSFVPASSAKLHVLDGIYTRMGAADSIQQGRSTFLGELSEASHILQYCSSHSLVIIDELGRGTSTHDGVAIAYATLHYLLEQKKGMVLFVTHYPEIMEIQHEFDESVGAYHVSSLTPLKSLKISESTFDVHTEEVNENDITFLYKIVPGIADKCFGLNVAKLAQVQEPICHKFWAWRHGFNEVIQLPSSCIARAAFMAAKFETELKLKSSKGNHLAEIDHFGESDEETCLFQPEHLSQHVKQTKTFVDVLRKMFMLLHSASKDSNQSNVLSNLKEARNIAQDLLGKVKCQNLQEQDHCKATMK